jgi:hypothetical protein
MEMAIDKAKKVQNSSGQYEHGCYTETGVLQIVNLGIYYGAIYCDLHIII